MPLSTPVHTQVANALKAVLAGITAGASYKYTPDRVGVSSFPVDAHLDRSATHVIVIRPGDEEDSEIATGQQAQNLAEFFLVAARKVTTTTEDPWSATEERRDEVASWMKRDILKALFTDVTLGLGGTVCNIAVEPIRSQRRWHPEWSVIELRLVADIRYTGTNP
jgi:hypothetical protein